MELRSILVGPARPHWRRRLVPELGGQLAAAGEPFRSAVCESVERYTQPGIARELCIELGALARRSQLIGAAALALSAAEDRSATAVRGG